MDKIVSGFKTHTLRPNGYIHSRVFDDISKSIKLSLAELHRYDENGRWIVFGANLIPKFGCAIQQDSIVYNLESPQSIWMTEAYLSVLEEHLVLDYDSSNVKWLRERGVKAWWLPIQYHSHLTRLTYPWPTPESARDIDVLFYGSMTPRRLPILKAIQDAGFRCKWLAHEQWDQRDEMICRSKIVLNLHAYDGAPLEMARISYLLANRAFIISEGPADDEYKDVVMFQAPNNLPLAIRFWLNDPGMRGVIAQRGLDQFSAKPQRDSLRSVLREMGAM